MTNQGHVIKFYASVFLDTFPTELAALRFVDELGSVPVVYSTGEVDGWSYIHMSRVSGESLKALWPTLSTSDQERACFQVGQWLRALHELDAETIDLHTTSWPDFIAKQCASVVERQRKHGLREELLMQIEGFLKTVDFKPSGPQSLLHTEIMRDHVFFETKADIHLTGVIDFEPSMIGEREYDFASVGLFLSSGDKRALRAFLRGYGNLEKIDRSGDLWRTRFLANTVI